MVDLQQIGKYKVLGKIGQGAMGEVYKAHDPILNRYVAIKTMSAAIGADDELRKRFLREAQSAARLNHPNIITLYDFGEDQGKIYMAMELLQGADLKDLIGSHSLNTAEDKIALMEQICDGLAFAHSNQVVHRDLKPANIHIQPNGQIKIMDFGLARLGASEMTRTGMVMGTPNYMSPEQVRGQRADSRSDIFSLGAVFYELLTNRKAFDAESLHAVLFQVLEHDPDPVRNWAPDVPEVLVHLVERSLRKDPAERFQNAADMREALRFVRQVLEGTMDEESAINSILAPPAEEGVGATMLTESAPDVEATRMEPSQRVDGTSALDPAGKGATVVGRGSPGSRPPTLSGRASTRIGGTVVGGRTPGSRPPAPASRPPGSRPPARGARSGPPARAVQVEAPSRMPLYLGGGMALVALLAVGGYFVFGPKPPKPEVSAEPHLDAATQMLLETQLESAKKNLEYKDFKGAVTQAERVLKLDRQNAEAQKVLEKAQSTLKELETAADEARAAMQAGDGETASKALSRVIEIDPNHPVAAELSKQLDSRFKGPADSARSEMREARASAEGARAGNLQTFAEAASEAGEAEGLFKRAEYTVATQKFFEARNKFRQARSEAERRVQTPPPTSMAAAPPSLAPAPPLATPPPLTTPATLAPTPPPTTMAAAVNEEPAVRKVIADYERAIEGKDLGLFRSIKPNLSTSDEQRLRTSFDNIKSQDVNIQINSVQIDGTTATVRIQRKDTVNGKPLPAVFQTLTLTKGSGGWTIREIGQ